MDENSQSYFIGANLRRARDAKGWSQEVFAPMAGMSQANVSNIESNKQRVGWETITLMAEKLSVSPESLAGLDASVTVNVEILNGMASGNHNVVHNNPQSSGDLIALKEHIASLREENRFLRQQLETVAAQVQTLLLRLGE